MSKLIYRIFIKNMFKCILIKYVICIFISVIELLVETDINCVIKVLNSSHFNATRLHGNSEGTSPYETFSFSNGELSIQSYGGHRGYLYKINDVKCG